jgi:aryl-alcohol dehydrogenase-like predicted oxidoreductase
MSQFSLAWVLQNKNVSSAIIGASRPEQVHENVKASGVKLEADVMAKIDSILEPFIKRDPKLTQSPKPRA